MTGPYTSWTLSSGETVYPVGRNAVGIEKDTGEFHIAFEKSGGLVPVVAQDVRTRSVLMVAYMNREALETTLKEGLACYWSRSRQQLWRKGETSGNVQRVKDVRVDCDGDTILLLVEQTGIGACHTGRWSCFFRRVTAEGELEEIGEHEDAETRHS